MGDGEPGFFDLIDADGKLLRRIAVPAEKAKAGARATFEAECRARYAVDDLTVFLRDSTLGDRLS